MNTLVEIYAKTASELVDTKATLTQLDDSATHAEGPEVNP